MKTLNKTMIVLLCLLLCANGQTFGSDVELTLPVFAGDTACITAFHGAKQDTVANSVIDKNGYAKIALPAGKGISFLRIGDKMNFAFIRSDSEHPKIRGGETPNEPPTIIDSPENDSINAWFVRLNDIRMKTGYWQQGLQLYKEGEPQWNIINEETTALQNAKTDFDKTLQNSPLYAARYLEIRAFLDERSGALHEYEQDTIACTPFRRYLLDSLNMETLYAGDMWFSVLNTAVQLYRDLGNYQRRGAFWEYFADDMKLIYARIKDKNVKSGFAADLKEICEKMGWKYPL
jgi:hypothetical protein